MGTIYLIRHGQASFDSADYDNLSELGQLQAAQLGAWFKARKIRLHGFFSGSMNRHLQTAQAFASTYGVFQEPVQHAGLNEYDHEAILQALIGQYDNSDAFEQQVMQNADPRKAFQQIFEKAIARWVSGEAWHPEQVAQFEADGSYVLELPYADDRELLGDVLRHGADCEVLSPPELRQRVAQVLRQAAQNYTTE